MKARNRPNSCTSTALCRRVRPLRTFGSARYDGNQRTDEGGQFRPPSQVGWVYQPSRAFQRAFRIQCAQHEPRRRSPLLCEAAPSETPIRLARPTERLAGLNQLWPNGLLCDWLEHHWNERQIREPQQLKRFGLCRRDEQDREAQRRGHAVRFGSRARRRPGRSCRQADDRRKGQDAAGWQTARPGR